MAKGARQRAKEISNMKNQNGALYKINYILQIKM